MVTSDKVYENIEKIKSYKERDQLGGKDIYSASKSSSELIFNAYFHSFLKDKRNLSFGIARAGNVIGGGDWSDNRLIPDIFRSWKKRKTLKIRNPKATRPWEFVLDPLYGYLILSVKLLNNRKINGEAFNFSSKETNNLSVLNMVIQLSKFRKMKYSKFIIDKKKKIFKESKILNLNSNKSLKILKWKSLMSLKKIIKFISEWYEVYEDNGDIKLKTEEQLDDFIKLINK